MLFMLPRGPDAARWLSPEQKAWLAKALERSTEGVAGEGNALRTLADPRVLLLCLVYIGFGLIAQMTAPAIHDWAGSNLAPMLFLAACLAAAGLRFLAIERRLPKRAA